MPESNILIIAAVIAVVFVVFHQGITKLIKAAVFAGGALVLAMWLGNKSGWTIDGLVTYIITLASRAAELVTPHLDGLIESVFNLL